MHKYTHNLLKYSIGLLSFTLSYIIPKRKNLYIFSGIFGKTFSGNSKALFIHCFKNCPNIESYYYSRNKVLFDYNIPNLLSINSLRGYWTFLRAERIFVDCDISDVSPGVSYQIGNFSLVKLRHGDPLKHIGIDADKTLQTNALLEYIFNIYSNKNVLFHITSSGESKKNIDSAFITNNTKITGLPRNDIFFRDDLEFFSVKTKFNLGLYDKTILYTPTFRDNQEKSELFSGNFLEKLNKFLVLNDYVFLIKAHHKTQIIFPSTFSNIVNISEEVFDIQELLKYTDLLITDYSSIYIDFLLTKNPIIFYSYDLEDYLKINRKMYFDYYDIITKSSLVRNEYTLFKKILESATTKSEEYQNEYKNLVAFFHKDTNGSYIQNVLGHLKNK